MDKNMSFDEALKKLENIVNKLENGNISLEESLILFKEGINLSKLCTEKLNEFNNTITILSKELDGTYTEKNFEEGQDDK